MHRLSLTALALPLLLAPALAGESHPFSIHDMLAMQRIGGLQVSPGGDRLVFSLRTTDLDANRGRTDLWMANADGSNLRALTRDPAGDSDAAFSPDGRTVYFLSSRSGSSQIWCIAVDGGEAQPVSDEKLDVSSFHLSNDGTHVALSMEVFPGSTVQETVDRLAEQGKRKSSGMVYDQLFVRHWDTWKDGRRSHVFVAKLEGGKLGAAVDVMKAMDADCPTKPFGGGEDYTFAPDGGVVFVARDAGREEAWSTDFDLYHAPADASSAPRCLTQANQAWDASPVFSPDGKQLAYLAMARPGFESDRFQLMVHAWPNGEARAVAPHFDRSPGSITWSADGQEILAAADHLGQHALFAVRVADGKERVVVGEGTVRDFVPVGDQIVFGMDHLRSPVELYRVPAAGGTPTRLTHVNDAQVAAARMGEPEQFSFPGWNGETVYCWIVKPIDFDATKKYPVAFLIHGGPQGSFGNDFHYRWNPQAYAGAGYAAVMVDFHGSTGYGQAFTDSITGDWGGKPFEDLQKGLAATLARYSWMDGDRVAALGASFGGYMINWIAGNWPDRFRCLVCHDGNLDEKMAYYDTEELWFPEWENHGTPWEAPHFGHHNPIDHVAKWKTPELVIHGALDYRVVDTQGLSTFTALQRRGVPSKLLYFPDENHWVLKPANSVLWHETVIEWLDRWTKGGN